MPTYFDKDPPAFYEVPFGYHDQDEIKRVLTEAGFQEIKTEVVAKVGAASRAEDAATGLVEGNPVAVAIAKRDPSLLPVITNPWLKRSRIGSEKQTFVLR